MPRRVPPIARPDLEPEELLYLFTGASWCVDRDWTPAELAIAWAPVRSVALRLYSTQCPGARPWIWWVCDAPAPRVPVVGAHECPQRETTLRSHKHGRLWYGKPGVLVCPRCWDERWESQARYLRRYGLLLAPEEARVPITLAACDPWFTQRYPDGEKFPPTPWSLGEQKDGCNRFLKKVHI